jgi:Domain of unknown function (DUF3127)
MQFTGKITFISAEEKVGQNQTAKVTVVLEETDSQYPNSVSFDLLGEKIDLIKQFRVWSTVEASLNSRCNEYNGKHYNSIRARKIVAKEAWSTAATKPAANDDLPF